MQGTVNVLMNDKRMARMESLRQLLIDKGMYTTRVVIGAAITPKAIPVSDDQQWVSRVLLNTRYGKP